MKVLLAILSESDGLLLGILDFQIIYSNETHSSLFSVYPASSDCAMNRLLQKKDGCLEIRRQMQ